MIAWPLEPVADPVRLSRRFAVAIGISYSLDGLVLLAFAWTGAVPYWVAPAYVVAGLACAGGFHAAIARGRTSGYADPVLALPQLAAAALVQLTFIVLAPPVAMYFIGVLFVLFGFASLRMRLREALAAWAGVSIAVAVAIALLPGALDLPNGGPAQRLLVGVSILLALGRSMLLGVYGSWIRVRLGRRYAAALATSHETHARQDAIVARTLHEDVGQDLAGIALALAAHETRLRRAGVDAAEDVAIAVAQLRGAVEKTRHLAVSLEAAAYDDGGVGSPQGVVAPCAQRDEPKAGLGAFDAAPAAR
jgi:signal transduction histidine kinase